MALPIYTSNNTVGTQTPANSGGGYSISSISNTAINAASNLSSINNSISQAAGGVGSALNGITGLQNGFTNIGNIASNTYGSIANSSSLGGIIDTIGRGISDFLIPIGSIINAAGQINNLLSVFRARSLPSGGELFKALGASVDLTIAPAQADDWRVRINCDFATLFGSPIFTPLINTGGVVWPLLPNISITHKANYKTETPIHSNQPFHAYQNSMIEDISISGEFIVQTEEDGRYWIAATHFLKSASKMYFGQGQYAGNPPVICTLNGYGSYIFNTVPVIIKSVSIELKDDVDYIKVNMSNGPTWVPALSTIQVTVAPIYNRERLRQFNLQEFASGRQIGFM